MNPAVSTIHYHGKQIPSVQLEIFSRISYRLTVISLHGRPETNTLSPKKTTECSKCADKFCESQPQSSRANHLPFHLLILAIMQPALDMDTVSALVIDIAMRLNWQVAKSSSNVYLLSLVTEYQWSILGMRHPMRNVSTSEGTRWHATIAHSARVQKAKYRRGKILDKPHECQDRDASLALHLQERKVVFPYLKNNP